MPRAREPVVRVLVRAPHTCCELPSLSPSPRCLQGLPWWLSGKESACQCRRHGFDPWVGSRNGSSLQYSCLGNQETLEARCLQTIQLCQFPQCAGWGRIKVGLMASVSQGWGNPALTSLSLSPVGEVTGHLGKEVMWVKCNCSSYLLQCIDSQIFLLSRGLEIFLGFCGSDKGVLIHGNTV